MKTPLFSIAPFVATALAVAGCEPAQQNPPSTARPCRASLRRRNRVQQDSKATSLRPSITTPVPSPSKVKMAKPNFSPMPRLCPQFLPDQAGRHQSPGALHDTKLHVSVRPVNGQPSTTIVEGLGTADPGEKPGCVLYRHVQSEASILSINYETRVVTMRLTTGDTLTVSASDKLPDFDKLSKSATPSSSITPNPSPSMSTDPQPSVRCTHQKKKPSPFDE